MLIKIFCLPFDSVQSSFKETEVRDFFKDKQVVSVNDYFFTRNDIPYLTLVFKYLSQPPDETARVASTSSKKNESWKNLLSESDMGLFQLLRDWRSQKCRKEGVPPYVLFNNTQLAEIVKLRPQSHSDLSKVEGIGDAKIKKYADEILAITRIEVAQK